MKKTTRIRPVLESLESMMLLSTAAPHVAELASKAAAHVALVEAEAVKAPVSSAVNLHGTIKGTGKVAGTNLTINGSGNLGKVGTATLKTGISLANPPETITLTTKKGNLFLASSTTPLVSGTSGSTTYTITGGTKAYATATGSGSVAGTYKLNGTKITFTLRFS